MNTFQKVKVATLSQIAREGWGTLGFAGSQEFVRRFCTISAMLFSWKRRMAAIPAAPAARQEPAFARVMPPRARTGMLAAQAWRSAARPVGWVAGISFFSKTGAKTAKVAAWAAA